MKINLLAMSLMVLLTAAPAASTLRAAEPVALPEKKPTYEDLQKMTPEERRAKIKELRDKKAEGLTPEQKELRRKVIRERVEKRIAELKQKKTDGTLSEAENRQLELWEQRLKRLEAPDKAAGPPQPEDKPLNKPAESK